MLRFPPLALAACLAAGVGLWLTRASMDVARSPGGELRVAMFPGGAELAGLIVLAVLLVLLFAKLLRRALAHRLPDRPALPVDPLLPLLSLLWLAVPYLPWLPDAVPALQTLAGPARLLLWAIVLGQVVWIAWETIGGAVATRRTPEMRLPRGPWVTLGLGAAACAVAAGTLASRGVYPQGDQAHFLVIAESIARDGDLQVADNYEGGGYRQYYPADLTPAIAPREGAYPSRPVGLPLLVAPAFAAAGYPGIVLLLALVAGGAAALAWRWAAESTDSIGSATTAWLAVAGSAPFLLHGAAVHPLAVAPALVLASVLGGPRPATHRSAMLALQGAFAGVLPWLDPIFLPLAAAIAAIVALRGRAARDAVLVLLPFGALAGTALAYAWIVHGSPLPSATSGPPADPRTFALGLAAVWLDQEYGALPYAPALALAVPGILVMWRRGGETRRQAVEIAAAGIVWWLSAAAAAAWTSGAPAGQVVPLLPLLVLPIAWWDRRAAAQPVLRAAGRVLVLAGIAVAAALLFVPPLIVTRGDGSAHLLEWLAASRDLVRLVPSTVTHADAPWVLLALAGCWLAAAVVAAMVAGRLRAGRAGRVDVLATAIVAGAAAGVAIAAPAALGPWLAPRLDPGARAESPLLAAFDARARPIAVTYDRWRLLPPQAVPALFVFEGRPGLRRDPQPVRVLLNTRLALPAGQYEVEITPHAGSALAGDVGLQVGRTGNPFIVWTADAAAGAPWRQRFRLDVDAAFVGLRTPPEVESQVEAVRVRPLAIVDATARLDRLLGLPPVLAAARYGRVAVYFHGADVYPERDGFWVRGWTKLIATFARDPGAPAGPVRLRLHTGAAANRVSLRSGAWRTAVRLEPGEEAFVELPLLDTAGQAPVQIDVESGFVPAEIGGGSDRRRLGCWIEVLE